MQWRPLSTETSLSLIVCSSTMTKAQPKKAQHSQFSPLPIMKLSPKNIVWHIKESFSMKITTKIHRYPKLLHMINGKATSPFAFVFCSLIVKANMSPLFSTFSPLFQRKGSKHRQLHKLSLQRATKVIG